MVGLVIVSHSRALADALVDLVRQVTNIDIPIAVAAGVGTDRAEFGTDAVEIMDAIQSVYSSEGVLVLMDLGSAILSAEMALDLLPPDMAGKIRFCAAPVVEGAIAAGVQIGLGSDLEIACNEAMSALLPKVEHISGAEEMSPIGVPGVVLATPDEAEQVTLTLKNLHGLHARPAARFVQTAGSYDASIQVRNLTTNKGPVSAKSLNALATLGALREHQIVISAIGTEASQALNALRALVEDNFGEPTQVPEALPVLPAPPIAQAPQGAFQGIPISEGLAQGPIFSYRSQLPPIPKEPAADPQAEWERLERALNITHTVILQRRKDLEASIGEAEAAIFDAHLLIMQDPDLLGSVRDLIYKQNLNAAAAWDTKIKETAAAYQGLDDPYLRGRATDVLDVGNQVLFALADKVVMPNVEFAEPVILFAHELTPTEISQLDMSMVLGLITVGGGPTSHSAILARALGIPAISGVSTTLDRLANGTLLAMDGFNGFVWIEPSGKVQEQVKEQRAEWLARRERLVKSSHELATTRDGRRVEVVANVGNVLDAKAALNNGAEGIGLLRTEFLYLTRETPPSELEQIESLRQIGQEMAADGITHRPIIVRTLDVGGDKALPYIMMPAEANPFLGVRAIRLSLRNTDLFTTQLRAILLAGERLSFRIIFPMVTNLEEVLEARRILEETHQALEAEGLPHRWPIETGIMIEVPAAALLAPILAPHVDFFSIGTNDLTQYTLAAERGNPALSEMADALHPAVLRLIHTVVDAAHHNGKWVGVCGELAGDPLAVSLLVGLGIDELSMNPGSIPKAKAILRAIDLSEAQELSVRALELSSSGEVRKIIREYLDSRLQGEI
ncbi:MAG: phosphoenolpyruvate--protein phosphotransferase [Anaerolineales bacterium]|nr:phosphoenolpyruvate--protein phosphotransferase [Anaerolineales bacterium]